MFFDSVPVILHPLSLLFPPRSLFHSLVPIHPDLVTGQSQFTRSLLPNKTILFCVTKYSHLVATLQKGQLQQLLTSGALAVQCCCCTLQCYACDFSYLHVSFSLHYINREKPWSPFVWIPAGAAEKFASERKWLVVLQTPSYARRRNQRS